MKQYISSLMASYKMMIMSDDFWILFTDLETTQYDEIIMLAIVKVEYKWLCGIMWNDKVEWDEII